MIASSSSWRSSDLRSRSPVSGRRASTSSPSIHCERGKTPSSRPTRHTTRWGTERIGTIVQTVRVPVRKLLRVGRPASRAVSSARTSASRSRVEPAPWPEACSVRLSSRSNCACCHMSASGTRASPRTPSPRAPSQSGTVAAASRRCRQLSRRSTNSASRPASSTSLLPTSSSGSATPRCTCSSPDSATPVSTRSRPARQVFWRNASILKRARCQPSRPHRTPDSDTQPATRVRSSSSSPNRRRQTSSPIRSSTSLARARPAARLTSDRATANRGLVLLSARSASRTRRW